MPHPPNSGTPGPLQSLSDIYRATIFPCSSMVHPGSVWLVKWLPQRWSMSVNVPTGPWSLPTAIGLIWPRWQSLCPSTSMVSSFPCQSLEQHQDGNRLPWVAPWKHTIQSVRGTWTMAVARSPYPPSIVHSSWRLSLPFMQTRRINLPAAWETCQQIILTADRKVRAGYFKGNWLESLERKYGEWERPEWQKRKREAVGL